MRYVYPFRPIFLLIFFISADVMTKFLATENLSYMKNEGVILGLSSDISPLLKNVFLSTFGFSIFSSYLLLEIFYKFKSPLANLGLTCLTSGILGNVLDRIFYGHVVDFIIMFDRFAFNFADLFQWVGYFLLALSFKKEFTHFWPNEDRREGSLVYKKLQIKFILKVKIAYTSFMLIMFVLSYTFIKYSFLETLFVDRKVVGEYLNLFTLTYFSLQPFIYFSLYLASKSVSQKIYGPIFSIERFLTETLEGQEHRLTLRETDYFKAFENKFSILNKEFVELKNRSRRAA